MPSALAILDRPCLDSGAGDSPAFHEADPNDAQLSVLDLAATRGDGVFETISVSRGRPQALEPHLARFARSAAMLDLPEPDADAWRAAIRHVASRLADVDEAFVKTVLSRGVEGADAPTGWAYATASADFSAQRRDGIRVVTLDRGLSSGAGRSPWLLAGAKTLSYAVNRAALREAARRDADDVVFVSTDGLVLEGPTANVVLRLDGVLHTPDPALGILRGTTQESLFDFFGERGLPTAVGEVPASLLSEADGLWLVSSVRHAAPVRELDGSPLPVDVELTEAMNAFLRGRTE